MSANVNNLKKYQEFRRRNIAAARVIMEDHPEYQGSVLWEWAAKVIARHCQPEEDEHSLMIY